MRNFKIYKKMIKVMGVGILSMLESHGMDYIKSMEFIGESIETFFTQTIQNIQYAADSEPTLTSGANTAMHTIGVKLDEAIQRDTLKNTVFCSMGVLQTQALFYSITKSEIQKKVEQFLDNPTIVTDVKRLNEQLLSFSKIDEEELKDDEFGGNAFFSDTSKIQQNIYDQLTTLGTTVQSFFSQTGDEKWKDNVYDYNDDDDNNDEPHFEFTNGVYALLSDTLQIKRNTCDQLMTLGAKVRCLDFNQPKKAATTVNTLVSKDTHGHIPQIVSSDMFRKQEKSGFILLHTLHVKADWNIGGVKKGYMIFKGIQENSKWMKSARVKSLKVREDYLKVRTYFGGITLVSLPTVGGCTLTIRHSDDIKDLKHLTESEIANVMAMEKQAVLSFEVPFLKMEESHNLKKLLTPYLPHVLEKPFQTELSSNPMEVGHYLQKVTFDMTDKGITVSAATVMAGFECKSCNLKPKGYVIRINSPFTAALTKNIDGVEHLLFQLKVVDHSVMIEEKI